MPLPFFSSLRLLCQVSFFIATFVPSFFLIPKKSRHKSCNDEKKLGTKVAMSQKQTRHKNHNDEKKLCTKVAMKKKTWHKSRNEEKKGNGTSEPP